MFSNQIKVTSGFKILKCFYNRNESFIIIYNVIFTFYFFQISNRSMSEITNIRRFKQDIKCCREVRIHRPFLGYYHHVFVGDIDKNGCDIYHYASGRFIKGFPNGKITKVRLQYETYDTCSEILAIFNFNKGDVVEIVSRSDYPKSKKKKKKCIKKANSRVGEMLYTASFNNCESYVNWIFSNDNSSKQAIDSALKSLCVDELNLSKMFAFLLRDLPIIVRKITGWIRQMLWKLDKYLTSNLEKYWNKFVEKIEKIINNLTNPDSVLG